MVNNQDTPVQVTAKEKTTDMEVVHGDRTIYCTYQDMELSCCPFSTYVFVLTNACIYV